MKLKIFEVKEKEDFKCPICGTNNIGKVVLIPKYNESSRIIQEADVVHVECYFDFCKAKKNLWMSKIFKIVF